MSMEEQIINNLASLASNTIHAEKGDYEKDGILHCHKCRTPKEHIIQIPSLKINKKVPCLCKCAKEARDKQSAEVEKREKKREIARSRTLGFPEAQMLNWKFENDDGTNQKLMQAMKNYVEKFPEFKKEGKGLLLYGTVGTGKSFAAACVANALIDQGYNVLMTNFSRIINTMSGMYEGRQEYLNNINGKSLLILDDLGIERDTQYMQEQVFNIIDGRYGSGLPTIYTTNLSLEEMANTQDIGKKRIYDRILERCHPIQVNGKSRRFGEAQKTYKNMQKLLGI